MNRVERNVPAAIALIFTAPLVAEYLLGDIGIRMIGVVLVLAPMYGGGALLIREVVRRMGLGWSRILVLGAAYTLVEEGFTTMSLFNPDYLKLHGHFLSHAFIPALGMGGWWTLFMFNLHTFWSISVSIALVEGLFPAATQKPWLGRVGDSLVAGLFLVGCALGTLITLKGDKFVASAYAAGRDGAGGGGADFAGALDAAQVAGDEQRRSAFAVGNGSDGVGARTHSAGNSAGGQLDRSGRDAGD